MQHSQASPFIPNDYSSPDGAKTSAEQRIAITQEVKNKSHTLYAGANKRGLPSTELYQCCLHWADQPNRDNARELLDLLEDHWHTDNLDVREKACVTRGETQA